MNESTLHFSISGVISSFIFGVIGFWMFREGKRTSHNKILILGLILLIYPYFTSGPWGDWGIGISLCGLAYYLW